ncbi:hypothetical protein MLD52_20270 [Puniceicoccaceae bacterium K14]|nr:hypothetical protein [Puniceicoccaceae bacterium K14]
MEKGFGSEISRRDFLAAGLVAGGVVAGTRSEAAVGDPLVPANPVSTHSSAAISPHYNGGDMESVFSEIKRTASKEEMYQFLYAMPKGGDIHHHLGGGVLPIMWYNIATDRSRNGDQKFYTRVKVSGYSTIQSNYHRDSRNLMFWTTIDEGTYNSLPAWEKAEFKSLTALNEEEKSEWLSSMVLDRDGEGRMEFFEYIWPRVGGMLGSIHVKSEVLVENMKLFGAEGVRYLEIQTGPWGHRDGDGNVLSAEEANAFIKNRLAQSDAVATGVTVRFQGIVVRFLPNAEQRVEDYYEFIDQNRDLWVGLNMAGREDDNRGYAARFTEVFDKMLRKYPGTGISIHAGEAEKQDTQIFDTLRLGATRIGHGINLFQDEATMQLMRCGKFLVEINLISNEVLGYVPDLDRHPFPIYLRQGIPVCLNTDDRGMWHSNMTDEYFVAVSRYNLSWEEMVSLGRNSISHSFLSSGDKANILTAYEKDTADFVSKALKGGWKKIAQNSGAVTYEYGRRELGLAL